jgi:hypothetical protein
MTSLLRRLYYLLNRRRFDRELANDLEFHREMAGLQGNMRLGNALSLREEARDAWGWTWIDRLGQDLRYGARALRKSPTFAVSAILMLAIGIGVNVAVFGFFDLLVLRPMNVREPGSLVRFHRRGITQYAFAVPYPEAEFFRQHAKTLSAVIAVNQTNISIEGEEKPVTGSFVTANYFRELGGAWGLGRMLDRATKGMAPTPSSSWVMDSGSGISAPIRPSWAKRFASTAQRQPLSGWPRATSAAWARG